MEAVLRQWILSFMGITLNFSTGEIGWSSGTTTTAAGGTFDFIDTTDLQFIDTSYCDFIA